MAKSAKAKKATKAKAAAPKRGLKRRATDDQAQRAILSQCKDWNAVDKSKEVGGLTLHKRVAADIRKSNLSISMDQRFGV